MSCEFTVGTMNHSIRYFGFVQMPDSPPPLCSNARPPGHILVSNSHPSRHESWSNSQGLSEGGGGCLSFDLIDALHVHVVLTK